MKVLAQICAVLVVLALVGVVSAKEAGAAKEPGAKKGPAKLTGVVVKVDGTNLIIKGKDGAEKAVATDASTEVTIEGNKASLKELKEGMKVTVTPVKGTATKIVVPPAKPAKAPKAGKAPKAEKTPAK